MEQILLKIHGRVQGVFFRAETQKQALSLGVKGWVRNKDDGTVEVCAQGASSALKEFTDWCKTGPPGAKVKKIEQTQQEPNQNFADFKIIY